MAPGAAAPLSAKERIRAAIAAAADSAAGCAGDRV